MLGQLYDPGNEPSGGTATAATDVSIERLMARCVAVYDRRSEELLCWVRCFDMQVSMYNRQGQLNAWSLILCQPFPSRRLLLCLALCSAICDESASCIHGAAVGSGQRGTHWGSSGIQPACTLVRRI